MELSLDLLSLFAGVSVGAGVVYAIMHFRHQSATDKLELVKTYTKEDIDQLNSEIEELKKKHESELEAAREELSVVAYPYTIERGDDGWFSDDRYAEVGYKYQLFVRGVPCFEAHRVPFKQFEQSEVSLSKVKAVREEVEQLLASLASQAPQFKLKRA